MLDVALLPLDNDLVRLRLLRPDDAAAYAQGTADREVRTLAHLPGQTYTPQSVRDMIQGDVRAGLERGDLAVLAIADAATDDFAGSLVLFDVTDDAAEVGFWLHPKARGAGRARAALDLAARFAAPSGLRLLRARTVVDNAVSRRVLATVGFVETGARCGVTPSGDEVELVHCTRSLTPVAPEPIVTGRLRLRLHDREDASWLQRIYSRPEVARYLLDEPWTPQDAERHVETRLARTGLDRKVRALALVIQHECTPIGDVALWLTDPERGVAEIGWVLDPAHGGHGFAREAVGAVLALAFEEYGLHRVAAQMDARNTASARLAQKVGMHREAHFRQDWWSKGEWTDTVVYGMLAADRH